MRKKKYFDSLLKKSLILLTFLQLSCGGKNYSKNQNEPKYHGYVTYDNITNVQTIPLEHDLKIALDVERKKYGVFVEYEYYLDKNENYRRKEIRRIENFISNIYEPIKFDVELLNLTYPLYVEIDTNASKNKNKIEFLIKNENSKKPYYNLKFLIPTYGLSPEVNFFDGAEKIGMLHINLHNKAKFKDKPFSPPRYPGYPSEFSLERYNGEKDFYDNYGNYKAEYQEKHGKFALFGTPTKFLIAKRNEDRIKEENEKKKRDVEEKNAIEKDNYIRNLTNREINSHLEDLIINVIDADEEISINGAEVLMISRAKSPEQILSQYLKGNDLEKALRISENYPNNHEGRKQHTRDNGKVIFYNIFKPAKYYFKIIAPGYKAHDIQPYDKEPIINLGTNVVYVKLSSRGLKIEFGGKQPGIDLR